ncbi:16S rRNA (guanine(966)-N(2))-methyltransferase RsmD [Gephyromycinifex aptenodytis]|uniref:16S rRNA (guanine(966)-N(2))-methyltransferase RsmD n=1 Tax=Gephyromycinifex aptenodytis TaxID=2716227 RepID=UPI001445B1A2|nr:16S rRNA (guanine(966)-N(2))-methyltransferase RsmD [Gephyromycinifex aptenodytis]
MTRIIAGNAGGTRIDTPPGAATRPTSDRVREALFSRLEHLDALEGRVVLDLFAGSGALGLEAASRGASRVQLVESAGVAARVVLRNIAACRAANARVVRIPVERYLDGKPEQPADLVLADPPYDYPTPQLEGLLARLVRGGWLAPDALIVLERSKRSVAPQWPAGLRSQGEKTYGETMLWFARAESADDEAGEAEDVPEQP